MTEMKQVGVLVAGDYVLDHHVYEGKRQHFCDRSVGVRRTTEPGDAVLVQRFIAELIQEGLPIRLVNHGRWYIECLRNDWHHGLRDNESRLHNCFVPWSDDKTLTERIKNYDRVSVSKLSGIPTKAGLEVRQRVVA